MRRAAIRRMRQRAIASNSLWIGLIMVPSAYATFVPRAEGQHRPFTWRLSRCAAVDLDPRVPRVRQCAETSAGWLALVRESPALGRTRRPLRLARRLLNDTCHERESVGEERRRGAPRARASRDLPPAWAHRGAGRVETGAGRGWRRPGRLHARAFHALTLRTVSWSTTSASRTSAEDDMRG